LLLSLLGTIAAAGSILYLNLKVDHDVVSLITPGRGSAAAQIIHHDIPDYQLQPGVGHDGQSFYAIAREPMHLQDAAKWLDRPRYRLQRIMYPLLVWTTYPFGGGRGLVISQWLWAVFGVFLTGVAAALLAQSLGASERAVTRLALLVPLLPAALATLDLSVADELALGFALLAVALDSMKRRRSAVAFAVLAVLTKEVMLLIFLGWAIYRGRATLLRLVAIPAAFAFTWWAILHVWFAGAHDRIEEFAPGTGLYESIKLWVGGHNVYACMTVIAGVVLGVLALMRRGWRSPLGPAVAIQLALVPVLHQRVLAGDWNGTRATAPLLLLSIIALSIPAAKAAEAETEPAVSQPLAAHA
jgi:hypothetical protein